MDDLADTLAGPALRAFAAECSRPQPICATAYPDAGGHRWAVAHAYLLCTQPPAGREFDAGDLEAIDEIRRDERLELHELPLTHLGLLYAPDIVASALLAAAE